MKAKYWGYNYYFKRPAGTSRGVMTQKPCYFIEVTCDGVTGRGECGILPGLSIDNLSEYENKLKELCTDLSKMDSNKWKFWLVLYVSPNRALLTIKGLQLHMIF